MSAGSPPSRSRAERTCMADSMVVVSRRVISSRSSRLAMERANAWMVRA